MPIVECALDGRRVRVRPQKGQGLEDIHVQFPDHLRADGKRYEVEALELSSGSKGGRFYKVRGRISEVVTPASFSGAKIAEVGDLKKRKQGAPVGASAIRNVLASAGLAAKRSASEDASPDVGRDLTIAPSSLSRLAWRTSWNDDQKVRDVGTGAFKKLSESIPFMRETFASMYDEAGAEELPADEASAFGSRLRRVLESQPAWVAIRSAASMHRRVAAEATSELSEAVFTAIGLDKLKDDADTRNDPRDVTEMVDDTRALGEEMGVADEAIEEVVEKYDAVRRKADAAREKILLPHIEAAWASGKLNQILTKVAMKANESAQAISLLTSLGFSPTGGGSGQQVDVPEELIAEVLKNPTFREILRKAGRMLEEHSSGGKTTLANGRCDVVGIVPSDDLSRTTPMFRTRIASSTPLRSVAQAELLQRQAQSFEQRGEDHRRRGPMVLLADRSGSMAGRREQLCRGFSVATLVACYKERRVCVAVSFDDSAKAEVMIPGNTATLARAIACVSIGAGGGTNVPVALNEAHASLKKHALLEKCSDFSIATDGAFDPLTKQQLEKVLPRGGRLFQVAIDMPNAGERHPEFTATFHLSSSMGEKSNDVTAGNALRQMMGHEVKP